MSLHPQPDYPIPDETRRVARAAFPAGNFCLRLADEVGGLYRGDQFAELFLTRGQPAASPARLALVSVLQDVEGLSDYGKDSFQKMPATRSICSSRRSSPLASGSSTTGASSR